MDAAMSWMLANVPETIAIGIAVISLLVSTSALSTRLSDRAWERRAHTRSAVSVAKQLLPMLIDFIRNPRSAEANVLLNSRTLWREMDKYATMARRKTRRAGQKAVQALNAWEEAWRDYNYNPHTDERYQKAQEAAGKAREWVTAISNA